MGKKEMKVEEGRGKGGWEQEGGQNSRGDDN